MPILVVAAPIASRPQPRSPSARPGVRARTAGAHLSAAPKERPTAPLGSSSLSWQVIHRLAHQDFIRVTGWIGNLSIHIEREFFGLDAPRAEFHGRAIRGLTVEQHLAHLREGLLPLAERCGRVMREALSALESVRAGPSEAVERARPLRIALKL